MWAHARGSYSRRSIAAEHIDGVAEPWQHRPRPREADHGEQQIILDVFSCDSDRYRGANYIARRPGESQREDEHGEHRERRPSPGARGSSPVIEKKRELKKTTRTKLEHTTRPNPVDVPERDEPPPAARDIGGTWHDVEGTTYIISRNGSRFTIQEVTAHVGVTAQGQGFVGDPITFSARTFGGMTVTGELELSANGRQFSGHYTDVLTDESEAIVLRRQ
ncbi:MAG: hypothetical protein ACN4G0_10975 [Polyangiales bacterium]